MRHVLSKSTFMYGCQCPKRLALHKFRPDLRNPVDERQEAVFASGTDVGILARQLFRGGEDASPPDYFSYHISVAKTKELIEKGVPVIYEAAFQYEGLLCAVDILVKDGAEWKALEVKSSTSLQEQHIADAAFQYFVMVSSGLPVKEMNIVHVNREYIRNGPLDLQQLFMTIPVTDEVQEQFDSVRNKAAELKALVASKQIPDIDIGPHCYTPYGCDFTDYCWQHVPEDSVFDLAGNLAGKEWELYKNGIIRLLDIPAGQKLPKGATIQLEHYLSGEPLIDKAAVKNFLDTVIYPLWFLDFETFMNAVPEYDGTRPYQQIPFQYSLHLQKDHTSDVVHFEFLAEPGADPRKAFIESLLSHFSEKGTLVAYNAAFEMTVLKKLAFSFPEYASSIELLLSNVVDLMQPFRSKSYYHPEFKGSYSIKQVLPVLVPELSYNTLNVKDGTMAGTAFAMLKEVTDPVVAASLRKDLLEYCRMDTWAMVKILEKMRTLL